MEKNKKEMIIVGKLHRTHGVKGDLKVEVYPPDFKMPNKVYIKDEDGNYKDLEVLAYSRKKKLIKFKGYEDLEKAKGLRQKYFYIEKDKLPKLKEDEFYVYQLIGKKIIFNGNYIGKVVEVDDRLSTAYLIIKCADEKIRHLPFINEFVKKIDEENNVIEVDLPQGWLTL